MAGAKVGTALEDGDQPSEDDDDYGPALPPGQRPPHRSTTARHGPGVPSVQDLALRHDLEEEDQQRHVSDLRLARKADREEQRERLDDLLPRAEPGSRERQLEKKRLANETMRSFREKSPAGEAEIGDQELIGGGDGIGNYKRMLASMQQRKTEREVRREEFARARAAEREERIKRHREKEEVRIGMFRELAKQRFG
jgi:hypothetical protein